jgi:hypothetical protein
MGWALTPELSKKCRKFVVVHWGRDGLEQIRQHRHFLGKVPGTFSR